MNNIKTLIIVGQTASGKSDLAVYLAGKLNGEVISADSRQIYREFDLSSGKITKKETRGIKHYLLDIRSVNEEKKFNAHDFANLAREKIFEIHSKCKLPIIAGGTGFYIDAILNKAMMSCAPDYELRKSLESLSLDELTEKLLVMDPDISKRIDLKNKIKVLRALEISILKKSGKCFEENENFDDVDALWIGLEWNKNTLRKRIKKRLKDRYEAGMCEEISKAHKNGASWVKLESLGLEMRYCSFLLQGKITEEAFLHELENKIWQYAKRQKTYWKRNQNINWFDPSKHSNEDILKFVRNKLD